jgi:hypothetical protein
VYIMSGGAGSSFNEAAANDVLFYISGSKSSPGSDRGTSLFGGDLFVSGNTVIGEKSHYSYSQRHALEVSGSVRFGKNTHSSGGTPRGIIQPQYFSGRWRQAIHAAEASWIPLGNAGIECGRSVPYSEFIIVTPFDCTIKNMKISLSGSAGNTANAGNTVFHIYHGYQQNLDAIDIAGGPVPPPPGWVRDSSGTIALAGITAAGGMTINVPLNASMSAGERIAIAMEPTTGPSTGGQWDISGALLFHMNQHIELT